jgi:hypothetical protein
MSDARRKLRLTGASGLIGGMVIRLSGGAQ